jgi:hypothetical protein
MRTMCRPLWLSCFLVWYLVNAPASLVLIGMLICTVLDREVRAIKREAMRQKLTEPCEHPVRFLLR